MVDVETKFAPVTVSENADVPAAAVDGDIDWICGEGFGAVVTCVLPPPQPLPRIRITKIAGIVVTLSKAILLGSAQARWNMRISSLERGTNDAYFKTT